MKITVYALPTRSLEEFADMHGLEIKVHERDGSYPPYMRYYASFSDVETSEGITLASAFGNGRTVEEAIESYASKISNKRLVIHAGCVTNRRTFYAPRLYYKSADTERRS